MPSIVVRDMIGQFVVQVRLKELLYRIRIPLVNR